MARKKGEREFTFSRQKCAKNVSNGGFIFFFSLSLSVSFITPRKLIRGLKTVFLIKMDVAECLFGAGYKYFF